MAISSRWSLNLAPFTLMGMVIPREADRASDLAARVPVCAAWFVPLS